MTSGVWWLLVGILVLREGAQATDYGEEERKGKAGFCTPSPHGLYEPPCNVSCEWDSECPGDGKCCEYACHYFCMPPCREKAGHCPPPLMKNLHSPALCAITCSQDSECHGTEKCCETTCGRVCQPPLEDKPGKCPQQQRVKETPRGPAYDTCRQDQDCEGQKKCCFTGTSMGCVEGQ